MNSWPKVDPPPGADIAAWPFAHSVAGDFYMLAEAGRLLVSPVDEVADDPCDAQPDDYDIALAADRLEHYTSVRVARIAHRWAGLRTFTADRVPTAGFAPGAGGLSSENTYPRHLADINGDGAADIVGFGNAGVYDALSHGFHLV